MKKSIIKTLTRLFCVSLFSLFAFSLLTGCQKNTKAYKTVYLEDDDEVSEEYDIHLKSDDGIHYTFSVNDETFHAEFIEDTWTIYDSYKIKKYNDMMNVCQALSNEHPVPDKNREGSRIPYDMVVEWKYHNLAYKYLPKGNRWKESAKDVDLDPDDQGRTFSEIYEDRTGEKLDISKIFNRI